MGADEASQRMFGCLWRVLCDSHGAARWTRLSPTRPQKVCIGLRHHVGVGGVGTRAHVGCSGSFFCRWQQRPVMIAEILEETGVHGLIIAALLDEMKDLKG